MVITGFMISMVNFGLEFVSFYTNEDFAFVVEEMEENSESSEKEGSEKENIKDTDKISQCFSSRIFEINDLNTHDYPEKGFSGISVYLEYYTPPPEIS